MRVGLWLFVLATGCWSLATAGAGDLATRQADTCIDFSTAAQQRVEACTWMIGRAELGAANLAIAYHNRGVARQELADFAGALADLTAAIELVPSARAYFARGWLQCELSWRAADRGDSSAARASLALGEADLRHALAIDPSLGSPETSCY
jgi:tetratricopeptide (TPR) repeat protein